MKEVVVLAIRPFLANMLAFTVLLQSLEILDCTRLFGKKSKKVSKTCGFDYATPSHARILVDPLQYQLSNSHEKVGHFHFLLSR